MLSSTIKVGVTERGHTERGCTERGQVHLQPLERLM